MGELRIAVGGSAADPPHLGHYLVLWKLFDSRRFDRIVWIVSGNRPGKHMKVCPNHRIAMTELLAHDLRRCASPDLVVIYDDIYKDNTPTIEWLDKLLPKQFPGAEFTWFTGSDSVVPQKRFGGRCEIEASWFQGKRLYAEQKFLIIGRESYPLSGFNLPDNISLLEGGPLPDISSSHIRELISKGGDFSPFVTKDVERYIKRHCLYGYNGDKENKQ